MNAAARASSPVDVEGACVRVRVGGDLIMRWGGGLLAVVGVSGTVLGHILPGVVHAVLVGVSVVAVLVHMLVAGMFLTRPALKALRNLRRRIVVRWCVRMANLLVVGSAYPLLAVPWMGAIVPAAVCVGMIGAQRAYLLAQLRRDAGGVALHPMETLLLVALVGVLLCVIVAAVAGAIVLGLAVQWVMDAFGVGR